MVGNTLSGTRCKCSPFRSRQKGQRTLPSGWTNGHRAYSSEMTALSFELKFWRSQSVKCLKCNVGLHVDQEQQTISNQKQRPLDQKLHTRIFKTSIILWLNCLKMFKPPCYLFCLDQNAVYLIDLSFLSSEILIFLYIIHYNLIILQENLVQLALVGNSKPAVQRLILKISSG
jgi:hypothetical protein